MASTKLSQTQTKPLRIRREGVVVSDKMNKTRTVVVRYQRQHPRYDKVIWHSKHYYAHDEKNEAKVGDRVLMAPVRPLSKIKYWTIVRILKSNKEAGV